jgi:hypothetical protein
MDYIEIKIDRSTLPKDGERVEFFIPGDSPEGIIPLIGTFCEGDDMFVPDDNSFHSSWNVHQWRKLKQDEPCCELCGMQSCKDQNCKK